MAEQSNLLGGVFQSPSNIRQQGRNRLLGDVVNISQSSDPISAAGAMGAANLGLGLGNAVGLETQPQRTARIVEQVQRETLEGGFDPSTDPEGTFNFIADRFEQLGAPDLAMQALNKKREFIPEPQQPPAAFQNLLLRAQAAGLTPNTQEYAEFMRTGGRQPDVGPTQIVNSGPTGQELPDPPKDTIYARNDDGSVAMEDVEINGRTVQRPIAVPILGSKASREQEEAQRERMSRDRASATASSVVVDDFSYLLNQLGVDPETGEQIGDPQIAGPRVRSQIGQGGVLDLMYTGAETGDFSRQVESVQNTIAVDQLLNIKEQGSGLGQVPQSQLRTLSTLLGSLDSGLSNEKLAENIFRAKSIYEEIIETSLTDETDDTFRGLVRDISGTNADGQGGRNISSMPIEELLQLDPETLSNEELDIYIERLQ